MPPPPLIERLFQALTGRYLVVRPDAGFTIVAASAEFLATTRTDASIFGRALFDVFPGDPLVDSASNLHAALRHVLDSRSPHRVESQRYDLALPQAMGGGFEKRCWNILSTPVAGDDGEIEFIVNHVEEASSATHHSHGMLESLTEEARKSQAERERLIDESQTQRRIYETALNSTPDFVYVFDLDHRALYANDALLQTWGVQDVRGKRWTDLGYEQWHADLHDSEIDRVIATRAPIRGEIPFTGTNGTRVYDYIFAPVLGADGEVVAIAGTTRDITERQAADQSVREQAERLAQADRAKDEFLATLSHELRNPLAPLRMAIEVLRRTGNSDARSERLHAMMDRQISYMIRLVEDLLEMSRISRGALSLRKERVDVASVIASAVETSDPLIKAAGHTLAVTLPEVPLQLEGDPVRMAQIVANLLNNAAKYTEDKGRISVTAACEDDCAVIRVQDNGIGIAAELQPRLFEMFSRGDRYSARHQAGLGIGLALSRRLAQMHGGTLSMRSDGLGQGSEFTLRLPLAQALPAAEAAAAPATATLGHIEILLIDDNRDAVDTLAMVLESLDARVRVAYDGVHGLEVLAAWKPDVVLLDIGMPGMNGYEVAKAIHRLFPVAPPTLVALTGWGQEDDRRRSREAGIDHHLVKPADLEALQRLLGTLERKKP
ncbi:hybrid sensor histidine kinase/response regulator [Variovorax boronicumulans]|uniref:hybrid sensor histidine kinase/response regulator n=1 Tax=Variovorax boronicumulans TaxID=436515 RepID=UPI003393FCE9